MTDKEKIALQASLIESLEKQVKVQDNIIKAQGRLIEKTEKLADVREQDGYNKGYNAGYRKSREDIMQEHWEVYKEIEANEKR